MANPNVVPVQLTNAAGNSANGEAVTSAVASSATVVDILAANPDRQRAMIFNASTQVLSIKYGADAAADDKTWDIAAGGQFEVQGYTGLITGLWASANGSAYVTEVT